MTSTEQTTQEFLQSWVGELVAEHKGDILGYMAGLMGRLSAATEPDERDDTERAMVMAGTAHAYLQAAFEAGRLGYYSDRPVIGMPPAALVNDMIKSCGTNIGEYNQIFLDNYHRIVTDDAITNLPQRDFVNHLGSVIIAFLVTVFEAGRRSAG